MNTETASPEIIAELSKTLNKIEEKYGWNALNKAFFQFSQKKRKKTKMTRTTPINEKIYVSFGNVCRTNGRKIGDVLEPLLKMYIDKGEEVFN